MSALNIGYFPERGSRGVNFELFRASRANGDAGALQLAAGAASVGLGGRQTPGLR